MIVKHKRADTATGNKRDKGPLLQGLRRAGYKPGHLYDFPDSLNCVDPAGNVLVLIGEGGAKAVDIDMLVRNIARQHGKHEKIYIFHFINEPGYIF